MGIEATLSNDSPAVEPGGTATLQVTVANTGSVVDEFTVEVLGAAASWAQVQPTSLHLFPGALGTAIITITVPRTSDVSPGALPLAVRVSSREDASSIAEESALDVGGYVQLHGALTSRQSHGSRRGVYTLRVENKGNASTQVRLSGDCDGAAVAIAPPMLDAAPGRDVFAKILVRPHERFLSGSQRVHRFVVESKPDSGSGRTDAGIFVQKAAMGWIGKPVRWFVPLAILAVLGVIALRLNDPPRKLTSSSSYRPKEELNQSTKTSLEPPPGITAKSTSTSGPGLLDTTSLTPPTASVPSGVSPPTNKPGTTMSTLPPAPLAGRGAPILQAVSGVTRTPTVGLACNGFTVNTYNAGDLPPRCGDATTGDNGRYHLFWVIEPGTPSGSDGSQARDAVVSVWGQDQSTPSPPWTLELQARYPAARYRAPIAPVAVSMAVPSGPPQLAFGLHDASAATIVHVDVVQVTGSGPGAAVTVGVHVDANLANAGPGQLDAYNNGSHQVIQFYKGAWRVQRTDTAAAGPTNL